jgi:hypothetical protein
MPFTGGFVAVALTALATMPPSYCRTTSRREPRSMRWSAKV